MNDKKLCQLRLYGIIATLLGVGGMLVARFCFHNGVGIKVSFAVTLLSLFVSIAVSDALYERHAAQEAPSASP